MSSLNPSVLCAREPRPLRGSFLFLLPLTFLSPLSVRALTVTVSEIRGAVYVQSPGKPWQPAKSGQVLREDDRVKTEGDAQATLRWGGSDRVMVLQKTEFVLGSQESSLHQKFQLIVGRIKAVLKFQRGRKFEVKTPLTVAAVRGTEFLLGHEENRTLLEVYDGAVGAVSFMGEEVLVESGRRLQILPDGSVPVPELLEGRILGGTREEYEREVRLGLSQNDIQKAAAVEARLADYQEGKTLIDRDGKRVRVEEYVVRPAANEFKFVVLNERDDRFDYMTYRAVMNQNLPVDLSVALKDLGGKTGGSPDYHRLTEESVRSNTVDSYTETNTGGHLVSTVLTEDISLYHPDTDSFETVPAGTTMWQTLFDYNSVRVNGMEKSGWEPIPGNSNITAYDYSQYRTRILGAVVTSQAAEDALQVSAIIRPSAGDLMHEAVRLNYSGDGSFLQFDFYVIGDDGKLASSSDFSGASSGQSYQETLLKWNYQQVITATEFQGRKIDLVVEPKILIKSGLLE